MSSATVDSFFRERKNYEWPQGQGETIAEKLEVARKQKEYEEKTKKYQEVQKRVKEHVVENPRLKSGFFERRIILRIVLPILPNPLIATLVLFKSFLFR